MRSEAEDAAGSRVPSAPVAKSAESASHIRASVARRMAARARVRRVIPGIVVGSGSLLGAGVLVGWVADQPGMVTASPLKVAEMTVPTTVPAGGGALSVLDQRIAADEVQVRALEATLAGLRQRGASAGSTSSTHPAPAGQPVPAQTLHTPAPTAAPTRVAAPAAAPAPAPAPTTHATTGATPAVP